MKKKKTRIIDIWYCRDSNGQVWKLFTDGERTLTIQVDKPHRPLTKLEELYSAQHVDNS